MMEVYRGLNRQHPALTVRPGAVYSALAYGWSGQLPTMSAMERRSLVTCCLHSTRFIEQWSEEVQTVESGESPNYRTLYTLASVIMRPSGITQAEARPRHRD